MIVSVTVAFFANRLIVSAAAAVPADIGEPGQYSGFASISMASTECEKDSVGNCAFLRVQQEADQKAGFSSTFITPSLTWEWVRIFEQQDRTCRSPLNTSPLIPSQEIDHR